MKVQPIDGGTMRELRAQPACLSSWRHAPDPAAIAAAWQLFHRVGPQALRLQAPDLSDRLVRDWLSAAWHWLEAGSSRAEGPKLVPVSLAVRQHRAEALPLLAEALPLLAEDLPSLAAEMILALDVTARQPGSEARWIDWLRPDASPTAQELQQELRFDGHLDQDLYAVRSWLAARMLLAIGSPRALEALSAGWLAWPRADWRQRLARQLRDRPDGRLIEFWLGRAPFAPGLVRPLFGMLLATGSRRHADPDLWRLLSRLGDWLQAAGDRADASLARLYAAHASQADLARFDSLWRRWLSDPAPARHRVAIQALLRQGSAADDALIACLFLAETAGWRSRVLTGLARRAFGGKEALWLRLLASPDPVLRELAARACLSLGARDFVSAPVRLWEQLWLLGESEALRCKGACELALLGDRRPFTWLVDALQRARGRSLRRIWRVLMQAADARWRSLYAAELAGHPRPAVRRLALRSLSRLPDSVESREALLRALEDPDPWVRQIATLIRQS